MVNLAQQLAATLLEAEPEGGESAKDFIRRATAPRQRQRELRKQALVPRRRQPVNQDNVPGWAVIAKQELIEATGQDLEITRCADESDVEMSAGDQSYRVFMDYDEAQAKAIAYIRDQLEREPEIFNKAWLEQFVNKDRLRRDLYSDTLSMKQENWNEESDEDARDVLIKRDLLDEEDFYDGHYEKDITPELQAKIEAAKETAAEQDTDRELADPIAYLEDIYGEEDALKQAIEIAGIDHQAAAESSIREDGIGPLFAHYDHEQIELPSGAMAYRTN